MERMNGNVFAGVVRAAVSDGLLKPPGLFSAAVLLLFSVGYFLFYPVSGAALVLSAVFVFVSEAVILSRAKRAESYPFGLKAAGLWYLLFCILSALSAADAVLGLGDKLPAEKILGAIPFGLAADCREKGLVRGAAILFALCFCFFLTAVYLLYLANKTVRNTVPARAIIPCIADMTAAVVLITDAVLRTVKLPDGMPDFIGSFFDGISAVSVAGTATEVLAAVALLLNFIRLCIINIKIRNMKNAFCGKI